MVRAVVWGLAAALATSTGVSGLETSTPPCAAFWNASSVFAGRVESVARAGQERRVTFTVLERYRGVEASAVTVVLDSATACAARFRQGREFVVYARQRADGSPLVADCSRTREIDDAAADLAYARSVLDGSAGVGTIGGQVVVTNRDLAGRVAGPVVPAADISVRIARGGETERTVTNHAGDFSLAVRGAGSYDVTLDVPARYYAEAANTTIGLSDPRACGAIELRLAYDGRLAGRVLDAFGKPVAGLTIGLSTPNLTHHKLTVTDRDGRYEFTRLPAGRFVVGVASSPTRAGKPSRTYLPGVNNVVSASRLVVGEGERVVAPDFRLPAAVKYVVVTGFVLDADGRPAEGAYVYVKGTAEDDRIVGEPVAADFLGRFAVAVLAGPDHVVFAERRRGTRVDSSEQVPVATRDIQTALRLVLQRRY